MRIASKTLAHAPPATISPMEIGGSSGVDAQWMGQSFRMAVCVFSKPRIFAKTKAMSFFAFIFILLRFPTLFNRGESTTLTFVPANSEQLRSNGVLGHEAKVVERLEERHVLNPLLLQE